MQVVQLDYSNRFPNSSEGALSKGDQPKWKNGSTWYKADHMGYEGAAEVVVSSLLEHSNVRDFVSYKPVQIQSGDRAFTGCASKNFRETGETLVTFEKLHRNYTGKSLASTMGALPTVEDKVRYMAEFVEEKTNLKGVGKYITLLLEIDAFFVNEDRHTNNLAIIRNDESGIYSFCPVFDNGLSLLADTKVDYPLTGDIYEMIGRVKAKPFDTGFLEQMEAAETIYGSQLLLTFSKSDVEKAISAIRPYYCDGICDRIRMIVFEQMRKYQIFF